MGNYRAFPFWEISSDEAGKLYKQEYFTNEADIDNVVVASEKEKTQLLYEDITLATGVLKNQYIVVDLKTRELVMNNDTTIAKTLGCCGMEALFGGKGPTPNTKNIRAPPLSREG